MNHFALHDAAIFTVDPDNRVIPRGTLIVEDGRISAVGPSDELIIPPGMPVIDASGHALLPGLIDAHSHSSLMRGVTENMQLMEWLPYYQLEHRALGIFQHGHATHSGDVERAAEHLGALRLGLHLGEAGV